MDENEETNTDETAEVLIAHARSHDLIVTKSELVRWHRAGLLPRPQRHSLGRGRGMVSIYPPGTTDQLLALCAIHRLEKRLSYVAWHLWWKGYKIPIDTIRPILEQACKRWQQGIEKIQQLQKQPEQLSKYLDQSAVMRLSRKTLHQARKRVGRKHFPIFMNVLIRIASGAFQGYIIDPETGIDERYIVENALGLQRARTNRLANAGPWLTGDTGEILEELSSRLCEHPPGEDLSSILEADLAKTREEVHCFLSAFESISGILDRMFSRGAFGFSTLANVIRELGPQDQAMMLLFWRMFRSWGLGTNMDQLLEVAHLWHDVWFPLFQGLEQLRNEVPATAEVLAPKQMGFALRWQRTMEWILDIAHQLSQNTDVKAFFARHPELTEILENDNRD